MSTSTAMNKMGMRKEARQFIYDYKSANPCVDCGESDVVVLTLDHVRGVKSGNISDLVRVGASIALLKKELLKCEVRCCNCHARRTALQFGWYKDMDKSLDSK